MFCFNNYAAAGSPYVTVVYDNATPVISSALMKISSVESRIVKGSVGVQYIVTLGAQAYFIASCNVCALISLAILAITTAITTAITITITMALCVSNFYGNDPVLPLFSCYSGNFQKWLVYCSEPVALVWKDDSLSSPSPIRGTIRIAVLPLQNVEAAFNTLITYVQRYPVGAVMTISHPSPSLSQVIFQYTTVGTG